MINNVQTTPFTKSLPQIIQNEIANALQQIPQTLPVSVVSVQGAFVTVKFELKSQITFPLIKVPQAISRYARPPTQIGDKGLVMPADVYLGGVTGLGGGTASYGQREGNLSTLVFVPLSNTSFPSVDANAYNITGPNGAVIKDDSGNSVITLTPNSITLACGSNSITINSSGISLTGTLNINGAAYLAHEHKNVMTGTNNTGGVV